MKGEVPKVVPVASGVWVRLEFGCLQRRGGHLPTRNEVGKGLIYIIRWVKGCMVLLAGMWSATEPQPS